MIYRLYSDNNASNTNIDGWGATPTHITPELIRTIKASDGQHPDKEITSIPSPWGRMDLIRSAFAEVVESKKIYGKTLNHKLISDTLDLAQICFHLKRFVKQGIIELVRWDKNEELTRLSSSSLLGHQELERALTKYLTQDAGSFNFDIFDECAVFRFVHPRTKAPTIIGGTSPTTLFFPAPGDLSCIAEHIAFGQDKPFDDAYTALPKREDAFIIWLYAIEKSYPSFSVKFESLYRYLQLCKKELKEEVQRKINSLTAQSYHTSYTLMEYQAGQPVYVLRDLGLYVDLGNNAELIQNASDFVVQTHQSQRNPLPLVLPTTKGWDHLHYVTDKWRSDTFVPTADAQPLDQRLLPGDGSAYPYLTEEDFLCDKLIKLKNSINTDQFYCGELDATVASCRYLLPLKPLFFEFFSVQELISKKMLGLKAYGDKIVVTLTIPIKGGRITYERNYTEAKQGFYSDSPDYTIEELDFELGLIQTQVYTPVCCIIPDDKANFKLEYLSDKGVLTPMNNTVKQDLGLGSAVYTSAIVGPLEALRIELSGMSAMIVPTKSTVRQASAQSIEYAVDLGTSNTCIAYRLDGKGSPQLLNWSNGQMISVLTKFDQDVEAKPLIYGHLSLDALGEGIYKLPLRTALLCDLDCPSFQGAMIGSCPSLNYQYQSADLPKTKTETNIKWSGQANDYYLKAYIYGLCVWMRKHADNYGVGDKIKLRWLYPSSMPSQMKRNLRSVWKEATGEIFGTKVEVTDVNEAVAPYLHLSEAGAKGRTVCMDIGGGTVDVLITGRSMDEAMHLTSFRFGSNFLYEAPTNQKAAGSGFARMLCDYLEEQRTRVEAELEKNSLPKISDIVAKMRTFVKEYQSAEAVDKFFSFAKQLHTKDYKGLEVELKNILQDTEHGYSKLRSAVLLYFALQVYHIARLIHHRGLERPDGFVFSGNGSRVLSVLGDEDFLADLVSHIFDFVAEEQQTTPGAQQKIKVQFNSEPKEATTYGAIKATSTEQPEVCMYLGSREVIDDSNPRYFQAEDEQHLYDDVASFAKLFQGLNDKLRLVRDWGYDRDSLGEVYSFLCNNHRNKQTFDTNVSRELKEAADGYSQSPFFSFWAHAIKEIVYELYPQK